MKKKYSYSFLFFLFFLFSNCSTAQTGWVSKNDLTSIEVKNLEALCNLYGLARYFYPNQSVKDLDWYKFLIYAQEQIEGVNTDEELISELEYLFRPIIPEICFNNTGNVATFNNPTNTFFYFWEHKGFGKRPVENIYQSRIVEVEHSKKGFPMADSLYCFQLNNTIDVYFPIAISYKHIAKSNSLRLIEKELKKIKYKLFTENLFNIVFRNKEKKFHFLENDKFRKADIMVRWNIIKHFYPYYQDEKLNDFWDDNLHNALNNAEKCQNQEEYYFVVCKLFSFIKDSHIHIHKNAYLGGFYAGYLPAFFPDIKISNVNDTIFLSEILSQNIYKGELEEVIVKSVNSYPIDSLCKVKSEFFSASTSGGLNHKLFNENFIFESFQKDSILKIEMMKDELIYYVSASNSFPSPPSSNTLPSYIREFDNNIFYVNPTHYSANYQTFKEYIPQFKQSKGVIFDMRGYPNYCMDEIITHFSEKQIEWGDFKLPIYYYPNQCGVIYRDQSGFLPLTDDYIDVPLVFLIDEKSISYCETIIEIVKRNKLGVLIGSNTNGTNGDVSNIELPVFSFIMTVVKDFSGYHGKGIAPDIIARNTVESCLKNEDMVLLRAIKYLNYEVETNY